MTPTAPALSSSSSSSSSSTTPDASDDSAAAAHGKHKTEGNGETHAPHEPQGGPKGHPDHDQSHGHGHGNDHGNGHGMPHRFEDAAAWAARFDAPERDLWQRPEQVIAALGLPDDAVVADLGAGTGYFAVRLARAVPRGRVLGLDVEDDMVRYLAARAQADGLHNLVARTTPVDRADIDAGTDLVLVVNTYHHIGGRSGYFAAIKPHLSARGRVVVVDFRVESDRGPPPAHKLAPAVVVEEMSRAGFSLAASHDFLPDQYLLVFAPGHP